MSLDLSLVKAASFLPGLQSIGTVSATATISGVIPGSGATGGNLVGSFVLNFPSSNVMSSLRATFPDAHGDLASYWFPIVGTLEVYDNTSAFTAILYVQNSASGRSIAFDLVNGTGTDITLTNWRIQVYAHFYTYAW